MMTQNRKSRRCTSVADTEAAREMFNAEQKRDKDMYGASSKNATNGASSKKRYNCAFLSRSLMVRQYLTLTRLVARRLRFLKNSSFLESTSFLPGPDGLAITLKISNII